MKLIKRSFIILLFFAYFLVFGRPVLPELTYIPVWNTNLLNPEINNISENIFQPFQVNGHFGYLSKDGSLSYLEEILYGVAIDKNGFINYSKLNEMLVLRDTDGEFVNTVEITGFPFFTGNRRFVISYDSTTVSEIDESGSLLWQQSFGSSVSALSAGETYVFLGTTDGIFRLIDKAGNVTFRHVIKSSRLNVVFGGTVSESGSQILVISGIEPQVMTLWSRNNGDYKIDSIWSLDNELRHHAITGLSDDGLFAYVEADEELLIIELKKKKISRVPLSGRLQQIDFPGESKLIHAGGKDENGLYFKAFEINGNLLFYSRLSGNTISLQRDQNSILLGIDNNLYGFSMESM